MKAISSIIAVIIFVSIAISTIFGAFLFLQSPTETNLGSTGTGKTAAQPAATAMKIESVGAAEKKVYIRNTGSAAAPSSSLQFYVNDQPVPAYSPMASIEPGQTAEFAIDTSLTEYTLTVVSDEKIIGIFLVSSTNAITRVYSGV